MSLNIIKKCHWYKKKNYYCQKYTSHPERMFEVNGNIPHFF